MNQERFISNDNKFIFGLCILFIGFHKNVIHIRKKCDRITFTQMILPETSLNKL